MIKLSPGSAPDDFPLPKQRSDGFSIVLMVINKVRGVEEGMDADEPVGDVRSENC